MLSFIFGLMLALCAWPSAAEAQTPPPDSQFQKVVIDATPGEPMDLAVLPDGKVLHTERSGEVWLHDPANGPILTQDVKANVKALGQKFKARLPEVQAAIAAAPAAELAAKVQTGQPFELICAGGPVTFRHGDAAALPFDPESFDLIVCRAAFKNFAEPVQALNEMHRVLRPGGQALIIDMRNDASAEAIDAHVKGMGLGRLNSALTKWILKRLRKRAYSQEQFRQMASQTPFRTCEIHEDPIGLAVWLTK